MRRAERVLGARGGTRGGLGDGVCPCRSGVMSQREVVAFPGHGRGRGEIGEGALKADKPMFMGKT
jgi:hypothetical protein